jgi:hypothetical protein
LTIGASAPTIPAMGKTCPGCGAAVEAEALDGAVRCEHCGTVLYLEGADRDLPHRIVAHRVDDGEIVRAATEALRNAGRSPAHRPTTTLYTIPYFLVQEAGGAPNVTGYAAVSLPAREIMTIPIYGSHTAAFSPEAVPPGARLLEAALSPEEATAGKKAVELRHVTLANVVFDAETGDARGSSFWVETDRCRVLSGVAQDAAEGAEPPRLSTLWLLPACAAAALGLLVPAPWGLLLLAPLLIPFHRRARSLLEAALSTGTSDAPLGASPALPRQAGGPPRAPDRELKAPR